MSPLNLSPLDHSNSIIPYAIDKVCCRHCAGAQRVRDTWRDFASASPDGCLIDWQLLNMEQA